MRTISNTDAREFYAAPMCETAEAVEDTILCTSPEGSTEEFEPATDYEW